MNRTIKLKLTDRQQSVLQLAAEGFTDYQIGRQLHIAPRTVRHHLEKARAKIGAINTTHAVAIAVGCKVLTIPDPASIDFDSLY